ncbi:hypothetical protein [Cognatiluteimonas lumbrici]|uniref:hypothetical protein n=1 Tax=Cognatiluteimonas lumbrici TaxID=2559601 RepID=UPI00112C2E0E|nr:hypothetical protein [Luteimonas lumbrici]
MQLPDLQRELEARFGRLAGERADKRRIFALEHGLQIDVLELAGELSKQLQYGKPNNAYWLAWVVFATEVGYNYDGAEYWQTFKERLPDWGVIDTPKNRTRIRVWFRRFANTYNGVRPSGTWARQFRIIAWPITHAILPQDLQYQFAKSLHSNRYQIAAYSDPLAIGRQIHHCTANASSRFREFCQQEELVGRIALALLGGETEDLPLSAEATLRIVGDLGSMQEAREWLEEARSDIRRIRGVRRQRQGERTSQGQVSHSQARFNLRPSLLLSQEGDAWRVGVQMPSFASLAAASPEVNKYLQKTKVQYVGGSGDWHPARVLTIQSKVHGLQQWPVDGQVLRFKDVFPSFEELVRQEASLSPGPLWVCRIGNDGLAREVRSHQVRPGQKYIVLGRTGYAFRKSPALRPIELRCGGLTGIQLALPEHVPDDLKHDLKSLDLSFTSTVRIWPAGVPAVSWDGEGQSEWLSTDKPCFGIAVDHDVVALDVMLDGVAALRIPRIGVRGPSWVQLPPLPPGEHRMSIEVKYDVRQARSLGASQGEVILNVRNPLGLEETTQQRGGLMVIVTPADATLENLERGDLRLEVFGPAGREAQLFLEVTGCETDQRAFGKVVLPATLNDLWNLLPVETREDLGGSSACRLLVRADEIGVFALPLERESRPVRWQLRRSKHTTTIRLIDEAGLGVNAQCQMASLDQPTVARTLEYDACIEGIEVQSPGALFVVAGRWHLDAVIVSQPSRDGLHGLSELAPAPRLDGFASSPERISGDIALQTLWIRARVVGPLGAARQGRVVRSMRDALALLVCGPAWMQAERAFESSTKDEEAIAALGDAISMRKDWQNFPAKLRMSHREVIDTAPSQVVPWLLAISTGFRLCTDPHIVERALRYLTDPSGFVASSRNVAADIRILSKHSELARGARYLQILLGEKSWDWS